MNIIAGILFTSIGKEGLIEFKGPQNFNERTNVEKLHYYGHGWFKYYKKSVFEKQMVGMFGDESRQLALLLHGSDPFTEKIDRRKYELLLKQTHEAIVNHLERDNWKNKLTPFSGPQCNEDRGKKSLYEYNPDMRLKVPRNDIALPTSIDTSNNEIETRIDAPVVKSNSTSENHDIKTIFDKAAARVCEKCYKTRILDFRAAEKFPLGSYKYGGQIHKIRFDCTRLVNTNCDSPEDIVIGKVNDNLNLLFLRSENHNTPSSGLLVQNTETLNDNTRKVSYKIQILPIICFKRS